MSLDPSIRMSAGAITGRRPEAIPEEQLIALMAAILYPQCDSTDSAIKIAIEIREKLHGVRRALRDQLVEMESDPG